MIFWCVWCCLGCLPFLFGGMGNTVPVSFQTDLSCSVAVWILFYVLFYFLRLYHDHDFFFLYSVDSNVGLDVLGMFIGFFVSLNNTMMSSGLWNYCSTYCFNFSLNFSNWCFTSLCLEVAPKVVLNYSTSHLKLRIEGIFFVRLKCPPHPPFPW